MPPASKESREEQYRRIVTDAIAVCKGYKPKFGHGAGLTLAQFRTLYQGDPFYSWFGLDSPLMYQAHKAAGGMTSIYRQIGLGCQRLFQQILMDTFSLTIEQVLWSYEIEKAEGKSRTLYLDNKIPIGEVVEPHRARLADWLDTACKTVGVAEEIARSLKGPVFEVRQGYKSKDAKRQNADIANAGAGYKAGYLPVLFLLSMQIDDDVANRYKVAGWLILYGSTAGSPTTSTYRMCADVIGYDLAGFFNRNSARFKQEVEGVLNALLA